jgi:lipoprotein NlpI
MLVGTPPVDAQDQDPNPEPPVAATAGSTGVEVDLLGRALVHWREGDRVAALEMAEIAVSSKPRDPKAWMLRGQMLAAQGERAAAITNFSRVIRLKPEDAQPYQQRGTEYFREGKLEESLADFDRANELAPERAPQNWQRGIALYYANRFSDGRAQFELHQTVNSHDVENAVWHFLCTARESGLDEARKHLIPIRGDSRVPMQQIHELFSGKSDAEAVMKAAAMGEGERLRRQKFYAHLYLALYQEAIGNEAEALKEIRAAVELAGTSDYMEAVAKVHLQQRSVAPSQSTADRP